MKIAVIGATGNIGQRLIDQALASGHEVIAHVRDASAVPLRHGVTVSQGSLEDVNALTEALTGVDVVVSAIGPRIATSAARKPTDFMQELLPNILAATRSVDARLVLVSAFGVGASAAKASGLARIVYRTITKGLFEDKRLSELALPESGVDWTVVLPVNLKDATPSGEVAVLDLATVAKVPGLPTLTFADAAAGILQVALDPGTKGKHVLVTTPTGWKPA